MKLDVAIAAGAIAQQIQQLQVSIASVDTVIAENWPLAVVRAVAPDSGASSPAGTIVDLLPSGSSNPAAWKIAVSTARADLQAKLDALLSQLGAM